jgi:hypothetical protein
VPGVQAQIDVPGVGVVQEALDALLGVDVGVDVRVEHQLDTELLVDDPAELVGALDQVAPVVGVQLCRVGGGATVHVGVLLG